MNEQAEMLLGFIGHPIGAHALGGLDDDGEHAGWQAVLAQDRAVVQGQRDLLRHALAIKHQLLIGEGERSPGQPLRHDVAVEIGDLRPALQYLGAEEPRVAAAGEARIGIVVDHDPVRPPQQDHGYGRPQQHVGDGLQRLRPLVPGPQARGRPVEGPDQRPQLSAV